MLKSKAPSYGAASRRDRHSVPSVAKRQSDRRQCCRVFTNPDLQTLYNELIDRGSESLIEALKVGALIEDLDIVDLRSLQTAETPADIARVYANLEKGSRNHLRAFISNLDRRGETYTPSYLSPDEFEEIVGTPTERGNSV